MPFSFHLSWTLSPLKKFFWDIAASKLGTLKTFTAAGWPCIFRQRCPFPGSLKSPYLSLWYEDRDRVVLSWRNSKVRHPLDSQFIPHSPEVLTLVELHLIRDDTSTIPLVVRVLQVPSRLRFLHESSHDVMLFLSRVWSSFDYSPYLQILDSVATFVLRGPLPGYDISPEGREADFVNVLGWKGGYYVPDRCIDDGNSDKTSARSLEELMPLPLRRRPGEIAPTGRVDTTSEIPFRPKMCGVSICNNRISVSQLAFYGALTSQNLGVSHILGKRQQHQCLSASDLETKVTVSLRQGGVCKHRQTDRRIE